MIICHPADTWTQTLPIRPPPPRRAPLRGERLEARNLSRNQSASVVVVVDFCLKPPTHAYTHNQELKVLTEKDTADKDKAIAVAVKAAKKKKKKGGGGKKKKK